MKDKIKQEIRDFEDNDVKIAPGLEFNQLDTLQKSTHYYLSDFESGQYDDDGFRKYFYNITRSPTNNTVKLWIGTFPTLDFLQRVEETR